MGKLSRGEPLLSSCPHTLWVALSNYLQFLLAGWQCLGTVGSQPQLPPGPLLNLLYSCAWMKRLEHGLPVLGVKCEESQGRNQCGGASSRQTGASSPRCTGWPIFTRIAITGAGDIIDALAQAMAVMLHDYGKPPGQ